MCDGKTISFTIPMEKEVLRKTGEMLLDLADVGVPLPKPQAHPEPPSEPEVDAVKAFNADTAEAMGDRIDEVAAAGNQGAAPSELDKDKRPWDARIDSGKKTKTADGRWKLRRGVDKTLVKQVLDEYTASTPKAPVASPPPPPPTEPIVEELKTFADLRNLCTMNLNKIQPQDVAEACKTAGSTAGMLPALEGEAPETITAVYKELDRLWSTR